MGSGIGLVPGKSLLMATPKEGRSLAIKARPSDRQGDSAGRVTCARSCGLSTQKDPASLVAIAQVVSTEFATIAAANGYWR